MLLLCSLLFAPPATANPYAAPAIAQQATEDPFLWEFRTSGSESKGSRIEARLIVPPGHHVYRDQVELRVNPVKGVRLKKPSYPPGILRDDPITGGKDREFYDRDVIIYVDFSRSSPDKSAPLLSVYTRHQGCYNGLCYPAVERTHHVPL